MRLVSRLVLGLVSKLHGGYIEAIRLVAILVAMSHPIIPLGYTLARVRGVNLTFTNLTVKLVI